MRSWSCIRRRIGSSRPSSDACWISPPDSIFVGNGAAEIIQAVLHRFTQSKVLVNLPTFSPYYEFTRPDTEVIYNLLRKEDNFRFDPEAYLKLVERERPDTVVLINPNNPDGGYVPHTTMRRLLERLWFVPNVIVDESFIHFACEGPGYSYRSLADYAGRFHNLIVVKSMSKDFGVAGIRGRLCRDGAESCAGAAGEWLLVELLRSGRVFLRPVLSA